MERNNIFTDAEDKTLIYLVSQRPILYDLNETGHKNGPKKYKVWREIGKILNKDGDDCKKRWKNIKDTYFRQKRKIECGTGSAVPKNPRSKFNMYAKLLSFLEMSTGEELTINKIENDASTMEETQISEQDNDSSGLQYEKLTENVVQISQDPLGRFAEVKFSNTAPVSDASSSNSHNLAVKKRKRNDLLDYVKRREESRQNASDKLSDDEELLSFSDHLKSVLKKLPPILRIKAKNELYGVLTKYELLNLEQSPSHTFSSALSPYSTEYILPETNDYSSAQNTTTSSSAKPSSVQCSNSVNYNSD